MKVIEVLVDKLPSTCKQCNFMKHSKGGEYCVITMACADYQKRPNSCKLKVKE